MGPCEPYLRAVATPAWSRYWAAGVKYTEMRHILRSTCPSASLARRRKATSVPGAEQGNSKCTVAEAAPSVVSSRACWALETQALRARPTDK